MTSTTMTTTPLFLDVFAIHLASQLLGSSKVLGDIEKATDDDSSSFRLYWRTPIHPADHTMMMQEQSNNKTLFIDVSFDFSITQDNPYTKIRFGSLMILSDNKKTCRYMRGMPLNMKIIKQHAHAISIDLDSTNPQAMAQCMAKAMMDESNTSNVLLDSNNKLATIPLFYEDLGEAGDLQIEVDTVCELDANAMDMVLNNLVVPSPSSPSQESIETTREESADAVTSAFEKWRSAASIARVKQEEMPVVNKEANEPNTNAVDKLSTKVTTKVKQNEATATTEPKRRPSSIVVARAPAGKRRKRGKVTYSKA